MINRNYFLSAIYDKNIFLKGGFGWMEMHGVSRRMPRSWARTAHPQEERRLPTWGKNQGPSLWILLLEMFTRNWFPGHGNPGGGWKEGLQAQLYREKSCLDSMTTKLKRNLSKSTFLKTPTVNQRLATTQGSFI